MSGSLLAANLAALSARSPGPAAAAARVQPAPDVRLETARSGDPVPVIRRDGRDWYLHSRYDPRVEAARAVAGLGRPGYVAVLGLGAGHHVRALLADQAVAGVLVIESDAAHLRALAGLVDLADVLGDPRVEMVLEGAAPAITEHLLAAYQPLLCGPLAQLALEPRLRTDPRYFGAAAQAVAEASRRSAADVAVQARFGRRWFLNLLGNLPAIARGASAPPSCRRAIVAAAGPTLEQAIPALAAPQPPGTLTIATDTSLPALVQAGISPAIVLSIDCQAISYHHFLSGLPRGSRLALDAASPPLLGRLAPGPLFLASPHPLAALLSRTLLPLPALDSSGGNVTHAAVALAALLGAEEVEVVGADFSYPAGSPYARGTYFFPYFQSRATRLAPCDSAIVGFVLADADEPRGVCADGRLRYRSSKLERYRASLLSSFGPVEDLDNGRLRCRPTQPQAPPPATPAAPAWRAWLARYSEGLAALPQLGLQPARLWATLDAQSRNLWTTLLPVAAATAGESAEERMQRARQWCRDRIEQRLRGPAP